MAEHFSCTSQAQGLIPRILKKKKKILNASNETEWEEKKGKDENYHMKHIQIIFIKCLSLDTEYSRTHICLLNYCLKCILIGIIISKFPLGFEIFILYLMNTCIQCNTVIFIPHFLPPASCVFLPVLCYHNFLLD